MLHKRIWVGTTGQISVGMDRECRSKSKCQKLKDSPDSKINLFIKANILLFRSKHIDNMLLAMGL